MNNFQEIKSMLHNYLPVLKGKYPIEKMALFGSVTRNDFTLQSDVDILVEFNGEVGVKFFDLAEELERLLGRKVDLVSMGGLKKPYWKEHILNQAVYV
jgi:predicted nucleotidyltransferase